MHSHDKTQLVAKLGFQDVDKKNPRHDWASHYLLQEHVQLALAKTVFLDRKFINLKIEQASIEHPITKGEGQYKTTLGFLDNAVLFSYNDANDSEAYPYSRAIIYEVKITPVSVGEMLRQINFYRDYRHAFFGYRTVDHGFVWAVVTDFEVSAEDVTILRSQSVVHFKLGPKFEEYVETRKKARATTTPTPNALI